MTGRFLLILPLFFVVNTFSLGSLEEKFLEMQKRKAQDIQNLSPSQIDSIKNLQEKPGKQSETLQSESSKLDSLIQGPVDPDSALVDPLDTLDEKPKRYSQQIFLRSPGPNFGTTISNTGRSHVLGPGDQITLSLWGDKEKEYQLTLNPAGKVFIEGIGLVSLNGNSVDIAENKLRKRLSRIYSGIKRGTAFVEISSTKAGPIKVFVLGEVQNPGGFVFASNTSIFSAMYQAKGPTDIGTVRNLKLTRGSKTFEIDLYAFLMEGTAMEPNTLQDGDVLFAKRAEILVDVQGDVGRPAMYELKKAESVKELLKFAGGLNPTAAIHRIMCRRVFENGRQDVIDLETPSKYLNDGSIFKFMDGDSVWVDKSTEWSKSTITISGAVKYPGVYQLKQLKNVADLVKQAGGLSEDGYLGRVHVLRILPDGSSKLFSYSLENTDLKEIDIEGRDVVIIYSKREMHLPDSVEIAGAVFKPGIYPYSEGMTVKGLILRAGGFLPEYEVGRAICFRSQPRERKVESVTVEMANGLKSDSKDFPLQARDFILVPTDPNWYKKEVVTLAGEFKYPGKYSLLHPEEKLISVIKRSGGLKEHAYVPGFRFYREQNNVGRVGVDLNEALNNSDSRANIPMLGGDSIYIPERQLTVKVIGEVGFPTSVLFKKGQDINYYIGKAGGYTRLSDKKRVIIEYANGETTKRKWLMKEPDPGSVIFVPDKPEPVPVNWFQGLNTLLATMSAGAALILSIIAIQDALEISSSGGGG